MQCLQALDTALFHFINGSLSNPFFDWLMPLLSGANGAMSWFVLALVAAYIVVLIWGDARARLCAVLIFLSVAIGDGLVTNTIKHLVHRPRPCVALADTVIRLGRSGSGSMPSAHAANWFAAAMIVFIFYRRKPALTVPVALMGAAVAFSRVYNGVHYPSDVLAGALIGAGCAAAVAVAVQWLWQTLGRLYFPLWHARMPSLLNPGNPPLPQGGEGTVREPDDSHWLRLGGIVIVASLIGRLIYLASGTIELSGDEAYQWLWSKHLALSYYSKPPGIAWIQFMGTSLFGDNAFGVRFFSPVFGAILSWLAMRFLAREIGANGGGRIAFWLLIIVSAVPLLAVGSILMTIDPPLVLCWTWALIAGWRAVQPDGQTRDWVVVGIAAGLAFLCKYSALYLVVCFGIFFALWSPSRGQLRKPGPWLALGLFLLSFLPVVIWNAQHHWITVNHVAGNAGLHSQWRAPWEFIGDFWGSEAGLLNPIFFFAALWSAFAFWKYRQAQPLMGYLFCFSWLVFFGHALYAFRARILPNWIAPAVPAMFLLMALYWHERLRAGSRVVKPLLAAGIVVGAIMVTLMYAPDLIGKIAGEPLPGAIDPLHRVRAWKTGAELMESEREKLGAQGKTAFIICGDYSITGEFTFYSEPARKAEALGLPIVYCEDSDAPGNQFYFWPEYNYRAAQGRRGENAIYAKDIGPGKLEHGWLSQWLHHEAISLRPEPPEPLPARMVSEFERVEDLGILNIPYHDRVFHRVHLWACYNLK
jgi:membrane-associated phospholipid phosphatase